jgi:ferredoxin
VDFTYFVEGPLLWFTFLLFLVGSVGRAAFSLYAILSNGRQRNFGLLNIINMLWRIPLPFHQAFLKKPVYTTLRYIFHACLIVVPIWFSGHIGLWEESRFEWSWSPLPDEWIDWLTLILLGLAAFFLLRHIISPDIRSDSSFPDYILIIITAMPFLTGYFLTHDSLDALPFLGENMLTIHILSGEAMLLVAVFLFCGVRLNVKKCNGCAACELTCPTEALVSVDKGQIRTFCFTNYQCILCGSCVKTCPEEAGDLRHEISIRNFFPIIHKREIRSLKLEMCEGCGIHYVPEPQLHQISEKFTHEYIRFCPRCRGMNYTRIFHQLLPRGNM